MMKKAAVRVIENHDRGDEHPWPSPGDRGRWHRSLIVRYSVACWNCCDGTIQSVVMGAGRRLPHVVLLDDGSLVDVTIEPDMFTECGSSPWDQGCCT